jgi:UDP-N-acetylmuramoyl-L-alanyl-D-glutamate--2,6-diaminopimelate ligase
VLPELRPALGGLAAAVYGHPAQQLLTIGVTGTQGKTTVTYLLEAALRAAGRTPGLMGTTGSRADGRPIASRLTTPEAPDLHALLAVMVEQGVDACALEVSSHALVQGRVDGVLFDVAVFLNLGRDHLDFHRDQEDYFAAKAALFAPDRCRQAVIDVGDEWGRRLAERARSDGLPAATCAVTEPADWLAEQVRVTEGGSDFVVAGPGGQRQPVHLPLPGAFNVRNALAAVVALAQAGMSLPDVAAGLGAAAGVPGRMERVDEGQQFVALVDYAHKPDAVEAVLAALRPATRGRLLIVLGAGGERDPGKRPLMGRAAARLADVVVVTDDNPRGEDPAAIRSAVLGGVDPAEAHAELVEEPGRDRAIRAAVAMARPGDTVVIAGKGHETGQEVGGTVHPFDDRDVLRAALRELAGTATAPGAS